jgi:acyl-CoA thioesterase-1
MKQRAAFLLLLAFAVAMLVSTMAQTAKPERGGEKPRDPAFAPVVDKPGLPRVLLIGDSISIGYTVGVRELLTGKANVHRIPTNGEATVVGLQKLDAWLGSGKWDVIHFNWGLHDLKRQKDGKMDPKGEIWVPLPQYEENLRLLVKRLKATGAKLIWASTTPVPEGADGRVAGMEAQYNEAAARVMSAEGVPIDDLHALAASKLAEIQLPKNVHFKAEGSRLLAQQVAAEIEKALAAK